MSLILFYDTETSGLPESLPLNHERQPYCLQIGAGLYDDDSKEWMQKVSMLLYHGRKIAINERALSVHGISNEKMKRSGVPAGSAFFVFQAMAHIADKHIAYNGAFDRKIIAAGMHKLLCPEKVIKDFMDKPLFDIMKPLTPVCKIPGRMGGYKWPKLTEAYTKLINPKGFDDAHDAFADIMATFELWEYCQGHKIEPIKV